MSNEGKSTSKVKINRHLLCHRLSINVFRQIKKRQGTISSLREYMANVQILGVRLRIRISVFQSIQGCFNASYLAVQINCEPRIIGSVENKGNFSLEYIRVTGRISNTIEKWRQVNTMTLGKHDRLPGKNFLRF